METSLSLNVPCKINLHLAVGPRRPDGFHDIASIFLALDWGDALHFSLEGPPSFWTLAGSEPIPVENNIVTKAVKLFREASGDFRGLSCRLEKRVPMGTGLGGGSADAAYTLLACNQLCGKPLPHEELLQLAAQLGSDVPFFLQGPCAWVEGRGEILDRIASVPEFVILLAIPPLHSDTAQAFALLDRARDRGLPVRRSPSREDLVRSLSDHPSRWPFFNDFSAAFEHEQADSLRCGEIVTALSANGALYAALSGSGSACFGVYTDRKEAEKAASNVSKMGLFCRTAIPLARSPDTVVQ